MMQSLIIPVICGLADTTTNRILEFKQMVAREFQPITIAVLFIATFSTLIFAREF